MSVYKQKEDDLDKIFYDLADESDESDEEPKNDNNRSADSSIGTEASSTSTANTSNETIIDNLAEKSIVIGEETDEVILIDDDDDDEDPLAREESPPKRHKKQHSLPQTPTIDLSLEEQANSSKTIMIDYDFNLKVLVSGIYRQFRTTYRTPLNVALKEMIAELSERGKTLIVYKNDEPLALNESPCSLNLSPGTILNAIGVAQTEESDKQAKETVVAIDPDVITLKLQDGHLRHLKEFKINKYDRLFKLKEQYAKQFNLELESMRLTFDGDPVDDNSTAEDLDIEDDCVLDVLITRTK